MDWILCHLQSLVLKLNKLIFSQTQVWYCNRIVIQWNRNWCGCRINWHLVLVNISSFQTKIRVRNDFYFVSESVVKVSSLGSPLDVTTWLRPASPDSSLGLCLVLVSLTALASMVTRYSTNTARGNTPTTTRLEEEQLSLILILKRSIVIDIDIEEVNCHRYKHW